MLVGRNEADEVEGTATSGSFHRMRRVSIPSRPVPEHDRCGSGHVSSAIKDLMPRLPPSDHRERPRGCGRMAFTLVSSAVMTHPRRLDQAERIAAELSLGAVVVDPAPDDAPSALRTAIAAWAAVRPGASHHLVVQDDLAGPAGLTELVRRSAARHPSDALAFYTHWNSRNGATVRLAALAGASWVRAVREEFTPTLAVSLPAATAADFRRHAVASAD